MLRTRSPLAACLVLLSSACVYSNGDGRVFVSSDPPGAEIFLDGRATQQTTPAELELGGAFGGDHRILVTKTGFEPEERIVTHFSSFDTSKWNDGAVDPTVWSFPLFWTFGDFFFPLELRWVYVPHRLFVRLYPEGTFHKQPDTVQTK
jgi:hypothetical protein